MYAVYNKTQYYALQRAFRTVWYEMYYSQNIEKYEKIFLESRQYF